MAGPWKTEGMNQLHAAVLSLAAVIEAQARRTVAAVVGAVDNTPEVRALAKAFETAREDPED